MGVVWCGVGVWCSGGVEFGRIFIHAPAVGRSTGRLSRLLPCFVCSELVGGLDVTRVDWVGLDWIGLCGLWV